MARPVRWWWRAVSILLAVTVVGALAVALHESQARSRVAVADRFVAKGGLTARFVSTYVNNLQTREAAVAVASLRGPAPASALDDEITAFGFSTGALLDSQGRVMAIVPSQPSLLGVSLVARYAHLAAAVQGAPAVSNVVTSVVTHAPEVAFAVPFETPTGRRVFSGAYPVTDTPLPAFLKDSTTLQGVRVYLTDAAGVIVASSGANDSQPSLAERDPALSRAAVTRSRGSYQMGSRAMYFTEAPVPGTPWSLLTAAPSGALFVTVDGASHWVPWLMLGGLTLLTAVAVGLTLRLVEGRRKLMQLARTDPMSGLLTRRYISEQLDVLLADADRYDMPVSVLMIDIDHFKHINDTYGHRAGDRAIKHVADRLAASLRSGDVIGRWGGEEFLAVLPHTRLAEATGVAERLCGLLAASPIEIGGNGELVVIQTSVGVAQHTAELIDALIHRADLALYEAKTAGRNTVRTAV
jgi:diguanylate cyclase (GGDEF)-like protein